MRSTFKLDEKLIQAASVTMPIDRSDGMATPFCSGKLTLTNLRLVFEADVYSYRTEDWEIPLREIGAVDAQEGAFLKLPPSLPILSVTDAAGVTRRFGGGVIQFDSLAWADAVKAAQCDAHHTGPVSPAASGGSFMYALISGYRVGPLNIAEFDYNRSIGKIGPDTLIWPGTGEWRPASSLLSVTEPPPSQQPVHPPGAPIDNRPAWVIVAVPLVGAIIEYFVGGLFVYLYLAVNGLLCIYDAGLLRAGGHKAPDKLWECLIVPVYLWKRSKLLGQAPIFLGAWIAAFLLSLLISRLAAQGGLEAAACPLVTQIIQEQLYASAACKGVTIVKDVGGGFYTGVATLDNGNEIKITIQQRGTDLYVQIPRQ